MGYTCDVKDQLIIAPDAYYTDGTLIWPASLTYYFSKYSTFNLDERIVNQILNNKIKLNIDSSTLTELENRLMKKLSGRS